MKEKQYHPSKFPYTIMYQLRLLRFNRSICVGCFEIKQSTGEMRRVISHNRMYDTLLISKAEYLEQQYDYLPALHVI